MIPFSSPEVRSLRNAAGNVSGLVWVMDTSLSNEYHYWQCF